MRFPPAVVLIFLLPGTAFAQDPQGVVVREGESFNLFRHWPEAKSAPLTDLTVEFWLRPDQAAIQRSRNLLFFLTNLGGSDVAGMGASLNDGVLRVNLFGSHLESKQKLVADHWTHLAITFDAQTINKQGRLFIDGKEIAEVLVLEDWPKNFERFQLLGDPWTGKRLFTGKLGDFRISTRVRYRETFEPAKRLTKDKHTMVYLKAGREE